MALVMLYVLPMLLGRTYDLNNDRVGIDIFPKSAIDNAEVIRRYITDSEYRVVSDTRDARDFLDVSGELSLKVKTGQLNIEGTGSYLKDTTSRSNMVEILVKVHYETVTLTIPSAAKPIEDWQSLDKVNPGTHYARSITYGGDLVASLRFMARNSADKELIKATVQGSLQAESGAFGAELKGEFNQIQERVKDSASLEIHYYATVPIKGVPNDITSLMTLVDDFPKHTQEVNNGLGVPLRMELFPLSALNNSFPTYFETSAMGDQIDLLEAQFDDLEATKRALREWMGSTPPVLPIKVLNKVGEFSTMLERTSTVFYEVISNLNLTQIDSTEQFRPAFDKYDSGSGKLPDKYLRMFLKLKEEITNDVVALQTEGGGATYIHWGRSSCKGQNAEVLYKGWAAGAREGGTEAICYPDDPQHEKDSKIVQKRYDSKLVQIINGGKQKVYADAADKGIPCAYCRISKKSTTTTMLAGTTVCNGGKSLYTGFLMSTDIKTRKKEFICMDGEDPESREPNASDKINIIEATVLCGTLSCDEFTNGAVIPCVVCSY